MIVTADFDWLMSHMDSLKGHKCPVYVYFEKEDSIPASKIQDFISLGTNVHMVPVTEVNELHNPWLFAFTAAARANAACDADLYFAFGKDYGIGMPAGDTSIEIEGAKYYLHFVKDLPDIHECHENVLSLKKAVGDFVEAESKEDETCDSIPEYPRFDEFCNAIPSNAVPAGMTRVHFAAELYNVMQFNDSDCDIIDYLVESIGPAAETSIETLNSSDAMRALKSIVWNR